ncbi:MAG: class I SAM-dependent methyltransferase [Methyloligellaceae bacterium]
MPGTLTRLSAKTLRRITKPQSLPLLPELKVPGLPTGMGFEEFRTVHAGVLGAAVPYWVVAWPGGQALARFLLDQPEIVAGRRVVDFGCGSVLFAAAAMRAGAASAMGLDHERNALIAMAETARLNGVQVSKKRGEIESLSVSPDIVICAGDLWYERETGRRATVALNRLAAAGASIFCGDPNRPGRPRKGVIERAQYTFRATTQFEVATEVTAKVFCFRSVHHSAGA